MFSNCCSGQYICCKIWKNLALKLWFTDTNVMHHVAIACKHQYNNVAPNLYIRIFYTSYVSNAVMDTLFNRHCEYRTHSINFTKDNVELLHSQ